MNGLNLTQVKDLIVIPTLNGFGPDWCSPAAANLVLGTANKESAGLVYLTQLGNGPARGLWQMEEVTHDDLYATYLNGPQFKATLVYVKSLLVPGFDPFSQMVWNLRYACAMCRVKFRRASPALPGAMDAAGQAKYWKTWYNSDAGKGVVDAATISCFTAAIAA